MTKSALKINQVYKSFGSVDILKNINIETTEGEFLVLVGPSGCGKSTLLNCIAGFEDPSAGSISLLGRELSGKSPSDRDIAMVFQSYALYPNMNVEKNITFAMKVHKISKQLRHEKLMKVADKLQLTPLLKRKPAQLSGGQRQRVAMARALVREPKLFLFDEPLSNLDAKLRVSMRTEIKRLHQELGTTMVYVTHDQIEAMTLASRIVVMEGGSIKQIGTPYEIYRQPSDCFVAQFMGSPSMNLIEAFVSLRGNRTRLSFDTHQGLQQIILAKTFAGISDQQKVIVGVRPEHFSIAAASKLKTALQLRAEIIEPAGSDNYVISRIKSQTGDQQISIRLPSSVGLSVGDDLQLTVDTEQLCLFDADSKQRIGERC